MSLNPMNYFNVGQSGPGATSPVYGAGHMIRNILSDARRKGLLKSQSQFQTKGAKELYDYKNTVDSTTNVPVYGPAADGSFGKLADITKNAEFYNPPKSEPSIMDKFAEIQAMQKLMGDSKGIPRPTTSSADTYIRAAQKTGAPQYLQDASGNKIIVYPDGTIREL